MHWTLGGFLTFLLYVFASIASWQLAETILRKSGYQARRECFIWRAVAVLSILLAINIGLDGLGRLTALVRSVAMLGGWYSERGPAQLYLVLVALAASVSTVVVAFHLARNTSGTAAISLVVSSLLIAFVLVRAISLHALDQLMFARSAGVTLSSLIECGGIFIIIILSLWRREELSR